MSKVEARKRMKQTLLSGYRHHSYSLENQISDFILKGRGDSSVADILCLETYADVLAPERQRGMMNALICLITVLSRSAIENGVDAEQSFSLSDYYINEVEKQKDARQLQHLLDEVLTHYGELVHEELYRTYSLPVTRAIRYIYQHIFGPCRVNELAKYVKLNPQYLATIFKKEVGVEPSSYIRKKKMEEAKNLLMQTDNSVSEIAEILGYCNTSHFINEFKKTYGQTPKRLCCKNLL